MRANVLSIAPGLPFLKTLAESILDGRVLPGPDFRGDPLALADLTVFVPTRRAARALGVEFARALGGEAAILPAIRPLGEADAEALFGSSEAGPMGLAPTVGGLERRMLIARFVRAWKAGLSDGALGALAGEEIVLPTSAADALWLARDLCALIDEAENEGIALTGLATLAPDRLAHWWQLTLTFLDILTRHWPDILAERGLVDEAVARNAWLRGEAERLALRGPGRPVVAAGSTATALATLALLRQIAEMPGGAVVLPGLDRHLESRGFDAVEIRPPKISGVRLPGTAPGHPQYGLKKILHGLGITREVVDPIAPPPGSPTEARERFVSDALRPAGTTDAWGEDLPRHPQQALDGLALIEAADEREEALAIACAMRDALSRPGHTVALTTPDRSLARRVVAELQRFGIAANDSAGRPLTATPPGTLMTLAAEVALRPGDPIALVALLKHPLTRLGFAPGEARRGARAIEMIALRGQVGIADAARLAAIFTAARENLDAPQARVARPVRLIGEADRDLGAEMAARLEAALLPLTRLRGAEAMELAPLAIALTQAMEALAADPEGGTDGLYAEEAGIAMTAFLSRLVACPRTEFAFDPAELPDCLAALSSGETVRPRGGLSARAFVWGALEARLQSVDTMILGGLNEGTWPGRASSDAFLSRLMRAEIALEPPERRIGLAAHDFTMALGMQRVVLARAMRGGGAPAIAARWLQRLLTLAGPDGKARLVAEGATYLHHARRIDAGDLVSSVPPPSPRPPAEARPQRYSVTEVETLIRDPYAVHARRILRLEPLPELMRDPGAADRGNLYHAILAAFVQGEIDPARASAEQDLLAIARAHFDKEALPPDVEAVWWPRMTTLATNYIAWERARGDTISRRHAEARGEVLFADLGTTLSGYADRIDRMRDGSIEIIDFKTGTNPSVKQARALLAPQLPLEGAMARLGAFPGLGEPVTRVADLLYVRLREREFYDERLSEVDRKTGAETTGDSLSDAAIEKFRGLVAFYRDPTKPFVSRPRPFLAGDYSGPYDHLARAREWAAGADEGEDAP